MSKDLDNDQLQQFAEFIVEKMDERFAEQDKKMDERFAVQDDSIDRKLGVTVEKFESQLALAVENLDSRIERHIKPVVDDVAELKSDMKVVKAATKDTSRQVNNHEQRITSLEAKV